MISRDEIRELSHDDAVLSMCIYQYDAGYITWEEAMMVAASTLSIQNRELTKSLVDITNNMPGFVQIMRQSEG
jgi:hypothetical protein